ncbi:DUF2608 domain-containing protein [Bacteriovoracaceae bacterium]|nr:DUF2608 domain-containing protein [Bacteriovoracaceae bacterium]
MTIIYILLIFLDYGSAARIHITGELNDLKDLKSHLEQTIEDKSSPCLDSNKRILVLDFDNTTVDDSKLSKLAGVRQPGRPQMTGAFFTQKFHEAKTAYRNEKKSFISKCVQDKNKGVLTSEAFLQKIQNFSPSIGVYNRRLDTFYESYKKHYQKYGKDHNILRNIPLTIELTEIFQEWRDHDEKVLHLTARYGIEQNHISRLLSKYQMRNFTPVIPPEFFEQFELSSDPKDIKNKPLLKNINIFTPKIGGKKIINYSTISQKRFGPLFRKDAPVLKLFMLPYTHLYGPNTQSNEDYHFSNPANYTPEHIIDSAPGHTRHVMPYLVGLGPDLISASDTNKGNLLRSILETTNSPECVIFIDDDSGNIQRMDNAFSDSNISTVSLRLATSDLLKTQLIHFGKGNYSRPRTDSLISELNPPKKDRKSNH